MSQTCSRNATLRKINSETAKPSASSKRSGKSSKKSSTSPLLQLPPLLSSSYYRTSTGVVVLTSVVTVLCVLLSQKFDFLKNQSIFDSVRYAHGGADLLEIEPKPSGWKLPELEVLQKYGSNICSIERVLAGDLSPGRFEAEFRFKKPVLVSFSNGAKGWTEPQKWSKAELFKTYRKRIIHSGQSLDIVRKGGNAVHASSFKDFVTKLMAHHTNGTHEPTHYAFDRTFYWQSDLPKTLHMPKYFEVNDSEHESIFFLGSSMTGVVFHKHSDTWNGVVYGRKRWFLYPSSKTPPGGVHHGFSLLEWVNRVYPHLADGDRPLECVQEPGEILYLPEGTYHATLNLGDTIAVAIQKKNATIKTEELAYEATRLVNFLQANPELNLKYSYNTRLLEVYKKWLELLPENSEAVMKIGHVLLDMGDYSESLSWHLRAIEMDPYFVMAYIHLAKTFSALRDYVKAEAAFKKALEISPNLWDIYKEYGEFLLKQGRHMDALPIFRKGTELAPDMIPFWFYYKLCQAQSGDQEGAQVSERIIVGLRAKKELERD